MNNQPQSETFYPDISQIPDHQQQAMFQQGFNPNPYPPSPPTQQLRSHTIKSLSAWKDLVKQTLDWCNKNIHPLRIISISVVLCHSTTAGQSTIFYNNSQDQYSIMKIIPFEKYCLSGALVNTAKKWDDHHSDVMKTAKELTNGGGFVVGVSQLETGFTHGNATSVIWFVKKF